MNGGVTISDSAPFPAVRAPAYAIDGATPVAATALEQTAVQQGAVPQGSGADRAGGAPLAGDLAEGPAPLDVPPQRARLGHVDSLRLIAAGLVLLQHLAERIGGGLASALVAPEPGVAGVVLFFLISGYVIPLSAKALAPSSPAGPGAQGWPQILDWRRFAVRRLMRIYPLYLAALALVLVAGASGMLPWWADLPHAAPGRWLANILLVQDLVGAQPIIGVRWTLIIELAWYGLFAASLITLGRRAGDVLAISVPLSLLVLAGLSLAVHARIPLGRPGLIHAAVLGYQVFRFRAGDISGQVLRLNVAVFLVVTWLASAVSFGIFTHERLNLMQVIGPWTLATALFLGVVLVPAVRSARLIERGLIPAIGAASYSIYLLHPIAMVAAQDHAPRALFLPVALGLTALLAVAGYRLVERPGIALARRWTVGSSGARATVATAAAQAEAPLCPPPSLPASSSSLELGS
jgi:peptidoglycan/LPS O-acetylase OafA/YrhL